MKAEAFVFFNETDGWTRTNPLIFLKKRTSPLINNAASTSKFARHFRKSKEKNG